MVSPEGLEPSAVRNLNSMCMPIPPRGHKAGSFFAAFDPVPQIEKRTEYDHDKEEYGSDHENCPQDFEPAENDQPDSC